MDVAEPSDKETAGEAEAKTKAEAEAEAEAHACGGTGARAPARAYSKHGGARSQQRGSGGSGGGSCHYCGRGRRRGSASRRNIWQGSGFQRSEIGHAGSAAAARTAAAPAPAFAAQWWRRTRRGRRRGRGRGSRGGRWCGCRRGRWRGRWGGRCCRRGRDQARLAVPAISRDVGARPAKGARRIAAVQRSPGRPERGRRRRRVAVAANPRGCRGRAGRSIGEGHDAAVGDGGEAENYAAGAARAPRAETSRHRPRAASPAGIGGGGDSVLLLVGGSNRGCNGDDNGCRRCGPSSSYSEAETGEPAEAEVRFD